MRSRKKDGALKPPRKIDRRSSRGVMFENEGLRLRTIEINAEVERGQSDLRKLKRENETLKQQVWTLRDEYDKLESFVKDYEDTEDGNETADTEETEKEESPQPKVQLKEDEQLEGATCSSVEPSQMYCSHVTTTNYPPNEITEDSSNAQSNSKIFSDLHSQIDLPSIPKKHVTIDSPMLVGEVQSPPNLHEEPPQTDSHFNLDQLLDFASSFHYDRRKHFTGSEAPPPDNEESVSVREQTSDDPPTNPPAYSSVRRRSATVIEKVKAATNKGSVVKEVKQVSMRKDPIPVQCATECSDSSGQTTVTYTRSSYYFAGSLDGRSQSLGTGLNTAASIRTPGTPVGPLYSSSSASNIAAGTTSSLDAGLPLVSVFSHRTSSLVRLNSIEPNTLMISIIEIPQLWDITTQEVIDELEQQDHNVMPDIRGVRVAGRAAYVSLGHRETLQSLIDCGFTLRGLTVPLIDITRESTVLSLTGVPHYIADGTLSILLSAFGVIIGEIERRFYKGVDTGERFVRMKVKNHVKLPKYVTVGGCRIVLGIENPQIPPPNLIDWSHIECPSPMLNPHSPVLNETKKEFLNPLSSKVGQSSDPLVGDRLAEKASDETIGNLPPPSDGRFHHKPLERKSSVTSTNTFSSRCIVNLKLPERGLSTCGITRIPGELPVGAHKESNIGPSSSGIIIGMGQGTSSINAGHVLRVGSLGRSARTPSEDRQPGTQGSSSSNSPVFTRRSHSVYKESGTPENSQSNSLPPGVTLDDKSQDSIRLPAPIPSTPTGAKCASLMANGILRKPSIIPTPEQETLLPHSSQIPLTATIKNRLRIGRSPSIDSAKLKDKKKKEISRMESISENTLNDESTDVTPLGTSRNTSRRDSEKSSTSNDKTRKDPIDLPWCGCWGNGCF